jgi:RNA polymerase sigma-70 factor (ECF subfamily)
MTAYTLFLVDRRMLEAADRADRDIQCAPAGSAAAFRLVLEEAWPASEPRLARLALGLGLKGDQVADILQDVYLTAIQKPPNINDQAALTRWLIQVTVNRCRLHHRRGSRWQRLWTSLAGTWRTSQESSHRAQHGELKIELDRALAKLSEGDRTLVVLRYFLDLNSRQISEIENIPEGTVRTRLRAARHKLANELAHWNV